jgi:hypothetical protein
MKAALCFLISYDHSLNKEALWREWIEPNKDIINVYFHYKDYQKIKSPWIKKHALPIANIQPTSYFHVVPAYLALISFAQRQSRENVWFIMLTESCVPIISRLFFENHSKTIMNWKQAWWNIDLVKRANLRCIKLEYHLANDPYFVLKREDVSRCLEFPMYNNRLFKIICDGGVANESIFAIILYSYKQLGFVSSAVTHAADWKRTSSPTSPHVFNEGNEQDITFIHDFLKENKYTMFLRKVNPAFPDEILRKFISNIFPEDANSFNIYWKSNHKLYFFLFLALAFPVLYLLFNSF